MKKRLLMLVIGLVSGALLMGLLPPRYPDRARLHAANYPNYEVSPLSQHQVWWSEIQQCTGFTNVTLDDAVAGIFVVAAPEFEITGKDGAIGEFDDRTDRLYVARGYLLDPLTVKHEMMHAMLVYLNIANGPGDDPHPEMYFNGRCGLLM